MFEIFQPLYLVSTDWIIFIVFILLIALFFLGFTGKISKPIASGLMVSLGILGTFWGILVALHPLKFTPDEINDSVLALIEGMKTAFLTSFLGLLFSIVSKSAWELLGAKLGSKSVNLAHRDMNEKLDAIRHAIAGDDDSSMVSQLKILRADNQEGFKKLDGLAETIRDTLVKNLQDIVEKLAADMKELIADQLGTQLEKLIKDINEALIDQFGSTFKEFNSAVYVLQKWQEKHREQVEQLIAAFEESAKGITLIKNECNEIPLTMEKLKQTLEVASAQVQDLDQRLEAFADVKKQAEESFPTIKENLDKIGEDLQKSASGFAQMEQQINDSVNTITESMRNKIEEMQTSVSAAVKLAVEENTAAINKQTDSLEKNMLDSQQNLNTILAKTIDSALSDFNKQIKREIDTVTSDWGTNLTAIARECAEAITKVRELKNDQ